MKNIILILIFCGLLAINFASAIPDVCAAGAQQQALSGLQATASQAQLSAGDPATTIGKVIGVVLSFLSLVLLIIVIYGGMMWMTAGGNEDTVKKARSMIIEGIIGLIICLSAFALTEYVVTKITAANSGLNVPSVPGANNTPD